MSDQPTIPPVEEPPVIAPPPRRPRNPVGWIISSLLIVLFTSAAVGRYADQTPEEKSYATLQKELKTNVSFSATPLPGQFREQFEDSAKEGLKAVLRKAGEDARESEEAARIAVVAAVELGQEPPEDAVRVLRAGAERESRAIVEALVGEPPTPDEIAALDQLESEEYAVRLASVQAKERAGIESNRETVLDQGLFWRVTVLALVGTGLLGFGAVALIAFALFRKSGRLVPIGLPGVEKSDGDRYMLRFGLFLIAYVAVGSGVGAIAEGLKLEDEASVWLQMGTLVVLIAVFAALTRVPLMDRDDSLASVVGFRRPFWKLAGAGLFGYLCTVPLLAVALGLMALTSRYLPEPSHPINEEIARAGRLDWLAILMTAAVLAPVWEELAFRGLLFPALNTQIRLPWLAMLACGLVFAAIHPQGPLAWPALAATGAAAAAVRYYTGSVIPSIVLHTLHNSAILAVAFMTL